MFIKFTFLMHDVQIDHLKNLYMQYNDKRSVWLIRNWHEIKFCQL